MFASLPKIFDKSFVIGFLLPVMILLIAFAWLFPSIAILAPLHSSSVKDDALGKLPYLILLSYGLAILLMMGNDGLYRLLEGYHLPAWLSARLRGRHDRMRQAYHDEWVPLMERWRNEQDAFPQADQDRANYLRRRLVEDYPPMRSHVMPTMFGNVITAFEAYPFEVYGADGTPAWLRMASVIPKDFVAELDDARSQVNLLMNGVFLLPLVAVAAADRTTQGTPWRDLGRAAASFHLSGWRLEWQAVLAVLAAFLV